MPAARSSTLAFAAIGLTAGLFGALLGVGGGLVTVPMLIMLCAFAARPATGTSLGAMGLTAFFGAVAYGILGRVHWGEAALIGLPAVVGVLGGTWLQQRVPSRTLVLLFAAFLVVIAVRLLLQ